MTWTEGMEKMIQINPREIAAEALMEIMTEEAYNNMTLRRLLREKVAAPEWCYAQTGQSLRDRSGERHAEKSDLH